MREQAEKFLAQWQFEHVSDRGALDGPLVVVGKTALDHSKKDHTAPRTVVFCRPHLESCPIAHLQGDTVSVVRLVANIFVVMTGLILGLMLNRASSGRPGL